jgi:prepilin-type N-terminal cleavage/methylation domain-containing protein
MHRHQTEACRQQGFTIVELVIASAVFSTVLLVALTGFLQIGHIFYKGVANAQTQNTIRQVVGDVSQSLKNTSTDSAVQNGTIGGYTYICLGVFRYTTAVYKNNPDPALNDKPVFYDSFNTPNWDPYSANANFGIIKDKLPGEGTCPAPCLSNSSTPPPVITPPSPAASCSGANMLALNLNNPQELLGNAMRAAQLSVNKTATSLYDIGVILAYGKDDVLGYNNNLADSPYCIGNSNEQQFCAVEQLTTSTHRGAIIR